ncbi:chromatin remodeling 42, CLASSY2 [Hibiscus trionum]|uniref:Chromatin remodeling 42, CLASSY2 n=1 Tax=Hibiscus trionum TaxID=183268 RepID=A0A9W7MTB9_HIBTR|nr:chromatin remodeling 42, CLASSY2 [Hibiscus trionum]
MRKRHIYYPEHSFDEYPFEVFVRDSWKAVKLIRIKNGFMTLHIIDGQYLIEKKPFADLRVRSRKAMLPDCTCFLRPGIDICVLSHPEQTESLDDETPEPLLLDAKISSIERKPHDSECSCQFYIKLYANRTPLGSEKGAVSTKIEAVGIDKIRILQKLEKNACDNQHYRWNVSEDCSILKRSKIFLGKFASDMSWLLVTSVLKQIAFDVSSVQNRIVYQILAEDDESPSRHNNYLQAVNIKSENGISVSNVFQFDPLKNNEADETKQCPVYDAMNLRRSKRRFVQPERFLGYDGPPGTETTFYLTAAHRINIWREEEYEPEPEPEPEPEADMDLPLSRLLCMNASPSEELVLSETRAIVPINENTPKEVKSDVTTCKKSRCSTNPSNHQNDLAIVPVSSETDALATGNFHVLRRPTNLSEEMDELSSYYYNMKRSHANKEKKNPALDYIDCGNAWKGRPQPTKAQSRSHRSARTRTEDFDELKTYHKTTLSAGAYNKLISSYMKNIDSTSIKDESHVIDRWNQFKEATSAEMNRKSEPEQPPVEEEEEISETEMLWREMEICMASTYFDDEEARVSAESLRKASENCQHDFKLDDEVGILCRICGFVSTEIKYVSAPFLERKSWIAADGRTCYEGEPEHNADEEEGLNLFCNYSSIERPLSDESENVWALIPELRKKLHLHQQRAFEFLWQNIAGSLIPHLMEPSSKKTGGCVVSHSPGSGKTFLIIAFLSSYLKLFPGKRPLVLAPKTTLYTWYKEFIKWEIPVPVHLIHGRRSYRVFKKNSMKFHGVPRPSQDVMHVLDCLDKIQKWHAQPSVLVMGYTSFLTLMREDAKFEHRKFMAKVLRESPGLLVLDEGHNPRSTKSRLRKGLMKVATDLRILLSGTIFQNNFCEYFNTLCVARPKFVHEVLRQLDPKYKKKKRFNKARHLLENRARKLFLDKIARKIDASIGDERLQGLNMLRNITNGFIDVYEGGNFDCLPGLQIYTLMMNSTDIQHEILVKLHRIMSTYTGYPLELELLITLASIHPSLVRTSNCSAKFFSPEELMQLEMIKFDFRKGSKVMFVLNLVYRIIKNEKVLIFCHNIAPINLLADMFERIFRWRKGREILILTGDLELFERGRVMDKFDEPGGPSRVLIASITACAEGISLTAASRVILLDSEWNPSKTKQAIARAFRPGQQKVVYVYQLLATGTLEEDKYRRTTWKEWVSSMIFSEAFVEDPAQWQAEKIEDDVLREIVAEDKVKSFHMIMKNEKASTG